MDLSRPYNDNLFETIFIMKNKLNKVLLFFSGNIRTIDKEKKFELKKIK